VPSPAWGDVRLRSPRNAAQAPPGAAVLLSALAGTLPLQLLTSLLLVLLELSPQLPGLLALRVRQNGPKRLRGNLGCLGRQLGFGGTELQRRARRVLPVHNRCGKRAPGGCDLTMQLRQVRALDELPDALPLFRREIQTTGDEPPRREG
jgi:hypothetical protein